MPIAVHRKFDGGMAKPVLNDFRGQGEPTFLLAIDAPAGEPVPQAVHAGIGRCQYWRPLGVNFPQSQPLCLQLSMPGVIHV